MITRRSVLLGGSLAAAATLLDMRRALGQGMPDPGFAIPGARRFKILEIFMLGGVSAWDTFYYAPPSIPSVVATPRLRETTIASRSPAGVSRPYCTPVDLPMLPPTVTVGPFQDVFEMRPTGGAQPMRWTKATRPLVARPDMLARTKVIAMRNDFNLHELAIPVATSGRPLGDSRACGVGTAVQRLYGAATPVSFGIATSDFAGYFTNWFAAGAHPGWARPARILIDREDDLATWAARAGVTAEGDALLRMYRDRYATRSVPRSTSFDGYSGVVDRLAGAPQLQAAYALRPPVPPVVEHCTTEMPTEPAPRWNLVRGSLDVARRLLANGAKHVAMIDSGIGRDATLPYDGHGDSTRLTIGNVYNLLTELTAVVKRPGEPNDPSNPKIDLDDTLVLLTSEFGRTPGVGGPTGTGREHLPTYAAVAIGGPVAMSPDGAPRLAGSFGSGSTIHGTYTPAQLASEALVAAGIHADHPHNFTAPEERAPGLLVQR
ncbi:MAG: DUF1501 domain-containing protein [Deltaproteobacteria bacterium]|nr:DUF1501 domain-containing protein [Deltaproteobacteria bacterium]